MQSSRPALAVRRHIIHLAEMDQPQKRTRPTGLSLSLSYFQRVDQPIWFKSNWRLLETSARANLEKLPLRQGWVKSSVSIRATWQSAPRQ